MRWYDRLMLGLLAGLIIWLSAALLLLGNSVADVDDRPTPVTITQATLPDGWSRCYDDDRTERWVPNLPVPAPGECT